MSAQDRGATEIVSDDVRAIESPMIQERGENLVLDGQRHVLAGALLGLAVPKKVIEKNAVAARQLARDVCARQRTRTACHARGRSGRPLQSCRKHRLTFELESLVNCEVQTYNRPPIFGRWSPTIETSASGVTTCPGQECELRGAYTA
jgi:hypothetical protein